MSRASWPSAPCRWWAGSPETGPPDPLLAAGRLAWAIGAGAVLGAAVGRAIVWLCERVESAPVEIAVSIAICTSLTGTTRRLAGKCRRPILCARTNPKVELISCADS